MRTPNKSLQRTFDSLPIFASAKTGVASDTAELRRYAENEITYAYNQTYQ